MNIGIVGHEAAKFTPATEAMAKQLIRELLAPFDAVCVSGRCPLGGIDVWAEEIADELRREKKIFPPEHLRWDTGFKPRNMLIALTSDIVHCLVVDQLPPSYHGDRYEFCYHCGTRAHVKSGGCWTAKHALFVGHRAEWHVISATAVAT